MQPGLCSRSRDAAPSLGLEVLSWSGFVEHILKSAKVNRGEIHRAVHRAAGKLFQMTGSTAKLLVKPSLSSTSRTRPQVIRTHTSILAQNYTSQLANTSRGNERQIIVLMQSVRSTCTLTSHLWSNVLPSVSDIPTSHAHP